MFAMFDILSFIVPIMFIVVFGIIIFSIIQGISTWHKNNNSPRLTVPAVIVAKRTDVSYHRHANAGDMSGAHGFHTTSSTTYYVTFQVESGDRMELHVSGSEYGMLAEGDTGRLTAKANLCVCTTGWHRGKSPCARSISSGRKAIR